MPEPIEAASEPTAEPVDDVAGSGDVQAADLQGGGGQVAAPESSPASLPPPQQLLLDRAMDAERAGRLADADRLLASLLAAAPDLPVALHLAGIVAFRQGRRAEALPLLRRAAQGGLDTPLAWRNLCEVLRVQGELDAALEAGQRAVSMAPSDAGAWHNLAVVHAQRQELDLAEACGRRALSFQPNHAGAHFGLAELLLLQGRFEEGWDHYRWRFNLPGARVNLPPGDRPVWDGKPLPPGRLLIVADQGYGDAIQFGRYLPWALARCPDALVACGRDLSGILSRLGASRMLHRWADVPEHDAWIPLSSLPGMAGTRLETIPAEIPYLRADQTEVARWSMRLDRLLPRGQRRIGLVWAGRPTHSNDHRRSTRPARLAPLLDMEGVAFVSLQKGEGLPEIGRYFGRAMLLNLGPELRSWADTMSVLAGLDAVVTVDTAVAHLAGAMGCPVHLLLPHAGEWRWLLRRDDTPWYPTMRLHRQPEPDDWESVARSVRQMLQPDRHQV